MGLGKSKKTLIGAFGPMDDRKKLRELEDEFGDEKIFGLTGKVIKRSKGFR